MNNKCYARARMESSLNCGTGLSRPAPWLTSAVGFLLLAACSSQGSSFGGAGSTGTTNPAGGSGTVDNTGGGANVGNTGNTGGGSQAAGGSGQTTTGGDVGTGASGGTTGEPQPGGGTSGTVGGSGGVTATGGTTSMGDPCPKPTGQICHEFYANDNSRNELHYVNEFTPAKNWTVKVGDTGQNSPRGIQIVDNAKAKTGKAILVSLEKGFAEFDVVNGALINRVSLFSAVTSAVRVPTDSTTKLPPGTTVLARDLTPTELDFVDTTGKQVVPALKMQFAAAGTELRKLERNATTGNFSFTKYESATTAYIYEVTEQGSQVSKLQLPVGAKGYNALWLDGGGMQATTGSLATVVTLDAKGNVTSTVGGKGNFKDASGAAIFTDFFSGFFRLPNGNVVAANWLGHVNAASYPNTPELLEISPTNQLVWSWGNQSIATYITYGYMIR